MTDAQYIAIAIATVLFAPWLMGSVMRHQRRAKDGRPSGARRASGSTAQPRQPDPKGRAK